MRWKDAIDRSHENKAVYVVRKGPIVQATVICEFFEADSERDEPLIVLTVERMGRHEPERYAPLAHELPLYLTRLGVDPRQGWEPV